MNHRGVTRDGVVTEVVAGRATVRIVDDVGKQRWINRAVKDVVSTGMANTRAGKLTQPMSGVGAASTARPLTRRMSPDE